MKTKRMMLHMLIWLLTLLAFSPPLVVAQDEPATRRFAQEELDQMLAPIALYPDSLLAQILMAATYPLEVAQADQWAKANRNLSGDQLNDALDDKGWDPSVKALVPFPQVLGMLSERLEWTQKLGDAFLDQEDEVMDTVQKLRARAQAAGNLRDTEQQRVIAEEGNIEIEPAQPEIVYVPVYDPLVIYGPWWYPAFPPFFFPPPRGVVIVRGFGFWPRIVVGRTWGHAWGHWDWRHHSINVNINRHININRNLSVTRSNIQTTRWQHDVSHRKGVSYRNETTRQRYGQVVKGAENRRDFRGYGQGTKSQPAPLTARGGLPETKSQPPPPPTRGGPPETKSQPPPPPTRGGPPETKSQPPPPPTRGGLPETKSQPPPPPTRGGPPETKAPRAPVTTHPGPDLSKDKSAFGSVGRGSDAQIQSNRGLQSRQGMSPKGPGGTKQGNVSQGGVTKGNVGGGKADRAR